MRYRPLLAILAISSVGLFSNTARADAIDGDWCFGGHHMEINGSSIVTPGRNKIDGHYFRYRFNYIVPANEPGAGSEITMVMIRGQEIVHLRRAGQTGDPEVWASLQANQLIGIAMPKGGRRA